MPDVHATLSASGSKRWLSCPPSAVLEKHFPDHAGVFAEEGTYAHSVAEHILHGYLTDTNPEIDASSEYYSPELMDYVNEYTDVVIEKINAARATDKAAIAMVEERLDFSDWVPGGFGTGDAVIISDGILEIVDLKYGKGVPVPAEGNTQMQLYALGAISSYGMLYEFDSVRMTIVQPRNGGVSEQLMRVSELLEWGESVKPVAQLAINGKGEYKAGDHCRFCKAACRCKTLAAYNMELAQLEFKDANLLTDEELADVLTRVDPLKKYADKVAEYALSEALGGHAIPGYKIVEGRSRRMYTSELDAADILTGAGYQSDKIYQPTKLLSITDMQKLLTKKKFDALLGKVIEKPPGKPTLAPESDKRPVFNPAAADFDDLEENE